MRFAISCVMENNNNKSTFSLYNKKQLTIMPSMTKCCISGCPTVTDSLIPFPPKNTKEYTFWLRACKESETNIIFKQNPKICALHFGSRDKLPIRYVTKKDIDTLNDDLARVNHCVAEWLLFIRKHAPDKADIEDKDVYSKAVEIGRVYQLPHFEYHVDFGWINIFKRYIRSRDIESWNPKSNKICQIDDSECFQSEESMTDDAADEDEESIKTYDEALKRVKILYKYCKRTKNKSALDIVGRLNEVLKKRV